MKRRYFGMIHHLTLMLILLLTVGCSSEHKVVHTLECVLSDVHNDEFNTTVSFTKEDAIKNGYSYSFKIYDDDTMVVNGMDVYKKDPRNPQTYFLTIEEKTLPHMQFQFTKDFDDVIFVLQTRGEQYGYKCEKGNQ